MGRILGIFLAVVVAIGAVVAADTFFIVHQTKQALVLQFGDPRRVIQEPGLHIKLPFVQEAVLLDRRILDLDTQPEEVLTSDQKRLIVDAFARFKISNPLEFYKTVTNERQGRVRLSTIFNSSLREVLAGQEFAALLSGERAGLMLAIRNEANRKASEIGVEVVDVRIRTADLPEANSQAVFQRMRAERNREAAEFRAQGQEEAQRIRSRADREVTVLLAEARRDAEIIRGQGDAERNRIFAQAFSRDPDFFAFYRSMQAYNESLSSSDTTMVLSPDSEFFRYFDDVRGGRARR